MVGGGVVDEAVADEPDVEREEGVGIVCARSIGEHPTAYSSILTLGIPATHWSLYVCTAK